MFVCDVHRDYQSPLTLYYICHISLANDFILTIVIWPLVRYNVQAPRYHLKASIKNPCFFWVTEETTF